MHELGHWPSIVGMSPQSHWPLWLWVGALDCLNDVIIYIYVYMYMYVYMYIYTIYIHTYIYTYIYIDR